MATRTRNEAQSQSNPTPSLSQCPTPSLPYLLMSSAIATELTFHYLDGRNESFTIYVPTELMEGTSHEPHPLRELMGQARWVLHLANRTVIINMNAVVKVEIQPPIPPQGSDLIAAAPSFMAFPSNMDMDAFDD
ncbi:MAG: hypothetical protein F6K30_18575 [Cyanothece sp. SIO2G6]|nr:hypothetical protein [Cyanothece sp. SIO2G6]